MTGEIVGYRYGWGEGSRISGSAQMQLVSGEWLPGEPTFPLIPFYPTITDGSATSPTLHVDAEGHPIWTWYPSRCDLVFYEGDDIVVPLYFNDPDITGDNLETDYEWASQIRTRHNYRSTLVADFSVKATYHPSGTGTDVAETLDEYTLVELFLPRQKNIYCGSFRWEIYSTSPVDYSRFPEPPGWDPDDTWPPEDASALKTWLYGQVVILPRTSSTDVLPTTPGVATLGPNGLMLGYNGAYGGSGCAPGVGIDTWGGWFLVQ